MIDTTNMMYDVLTYYFLLAFTAFPKQQHRLHAIQLISPNIEMHIIYLIF